MSQQAEHRWVDWKVWYEAHKNDGRDVAKTIEFLQKMLEGLMEIQGLILRDLRDQEGFGKSQILFTPSGVRLHND